MRVQTLGLLAAIAIASSRQAGAQEVKRKYPREIITREEIQDRAPDAKTAYDVIQRLRPQFLRTRASGSVTSQGTVPIKVYVDGASRGTVIVLRDIQATAVISIFYLDGNDATTRYGTNHENGAIIVKTGA